MKKKGYVYALVILLALAVLQTVAFAIPHAYTGAFWVGYVFTCLALVLQGVFALGAFSRAGERKVAFLGLSVAVLGYEYLGLQFVAGLVFMFVPVIPTWCALVVCILIFALYAALLLAALSARDAVVKREEKVAGESGEMRALSARLKALMAACADAALRREVARAYEAVRYSDPVAAPELSDLQAQIGQAVFRLEQAVDAKDYQLAKKESAGLTALCARRNELCRRGK